MVERDSYDPWGKRRNLNGSDDTNDTLAGSQTTHGYTDQEELNDVALLHLNARLYDPQIGKFYGTDPLVSNQYSTQGRNRFAYAGNNPLRYLDPSGMDFFDDIGNAISEGFGELTDYISQVFENAASADAAAGNDALQEIIVRGQAPACSGGGSSCYNSIAIDNTPIPPPPSIAPTPPPIPEGGGEIVVHPTPKPIVAPQVTSVAGSQDVPLSGGTESPIQEIVITAPRRLLPANPLLPVLTQQRYVNSYIGSYIPGFATNACPNANWQAVGSFLSRNGSTLSKAGLATGAIGLGIMAAPTPPTWVSGSFIAAGGAGMTLAGITVQGLGSIAYGIAGDYKAQAQSGIGAALSFIEPDFLAANPNGDPADGASEQIANFLYPSGSQNCGGF